jgi:opacity protein-like surface antigen
MKSHLSGRLKRVQKVGLGLLRETAKLEIDFSQMSLPSGQVVPIATKITEVDNARERVDKEGTIRGIRSTGTLGFRVNNLISGFAAFDPIAYLYVNIASSRMLRFSEPEIWLPAGTELTLKLTTPVDLAPQPETFPLLPVVNGTAEWEEMEALLRKLPFRTMTQGTDKPSDLTNLLFIGDFASLRRAFRAAGWVTADRLNANSIFLTLRSITEDQGYQNAPMSTLLLDELPPDLTVSKTLDTFAKRHHARVWIRPEMWHGMKIATASSTQDIGIELSRKNKTFIHVIDRVIDNERAKIVNDLVFTGCVDAAQRFERPWLPADAQNGTGETLITDRQISVLKLNDCTNPEGAVDLQGSPDRETKGNSVARGFRQANLTIKNDLYRGNVIYQAVEGIRMGVNHLKGKEVPPPVLRTSAIQSQSNNAGTDTQLSEETVSSALKKQPVESFEVPEEALELLNTNKREWSPILFEFSVQGGWLRYASNNLDSERLIIIPREPDLPMYDFGFQSRQHNGWSVGTSVTLNTYRHFSNEFAFTYNRGKYRVGASITSTPPDPNQSGYDEQSTGLLTRQLQYNLLYNIRPREKRFIPFLAAGPVFQMTNITDTPFKSAPGIYRVGLRNVGLLLAAYNFGSTPPLDGGGVFQFGFQYGAGVKYRFARHWLVRVDFRETLTSDPNFVDRSISITPPLESDPYTIERIRYHQAGAYRQQRLTLGFSFGF